MPHSDQITNAVSTYTCPSPPHLPISDPSIVLVYITDQTGKLIDPTNPRPEYHRNTSGRLFERAPPTPSNTRTLKHKKALASFEARYPGPAKQVQCVSRTPYTVSVDQSGRRSCVVLVSSASAEGLRKEAPQEEDDVWTQVAEE